MLQNVRLLFLTEGCNSIVLSEPIMLKVFYAQIYMQSFISVND